MTVTTSNYGITYGTSTMTGNTTLNLDKIVVDRAEYEELQADSQLLWALIAEGVEDDWDGYERAVLRLP